MSFRTRTRAIWQRVILYFRTRTAKKAAKKKAAKKAGSGTKKNQGRTLPAWQHPVALALLCLGVASVIVLGSRFLFLSIDWNKTGKVGFGIVVIIAVIWFVVWLFKKPERRARATTMATQVVSWKIFKLAAAIALLWFLLPTIKRWIDSEIVTAKGATINLPAGATLLEPCTWLPEQEITFPLVAEKDKWTETYCFPPGMVADWRAMKSDARFKMKTQLGEYTFTPEQSANMLNNSGEKVVVARVSFMAIGTRSEEIQVILHR